MTWLLLQLNSVSVVTDCVVSIEAEVRLRAIRKGNAKLLTDVSLMSLESLLLPITKTVVTEFCKFNYKIYTSNSIVSPNI